VPNFLKLFDGSGRKPRQVQIDALTWLQDNWDSKGLHVISAPVGSGKSAISKAIQLATNSTIIVPSNLLMRQYLDVYPKTNYLMGKAHYRCKSGLSCEDWTSVLDQPACEACPYAACKASALEGDATFYNPMSLYYLTRAQGFERPSTIVVDEAHELASLILLLCGTRLRQGEYGFTNKCANEIYLVEWLSKTLSKLRKLQAVYQKLGDYNKVSQVTDQIESVGLTVAGLEEDPQNYAIWIEDGMHRGRPDRFLNIRPVRPPKFLVNRILKANKVVLLSGTITEMDDTPFNYLDLPSPIPKESRAIHYAPVPFDMNYNTPPEKIAEAVLSIIKDNPGVNTLVHTTYAMSKQLIKFFPEGTLYNTETNKDDILAKFKKSGGILLGSGMAEGIDLPGDLCRLNIIPKLLYPNLRDPVVQKRKAFTDGDAWYNIKTLMKAVQAAGRSTRGADDFSKTYVLDPGFAFRVKKFRDRLPRSFTEAIVWSR
jgi:ATP-dependent DNA helicase DinG